MATDLGRLKSSAASKYDAIVASQLKQAETRIRMLDLTSGLFGFAALSLVYIVGMALCDSKFLLSQHTRQLALGVFLAGAAVYLFFAVLRPLCLRVNPYYAARQVEQQLPHAKNSIVNWVDLHEQPLPPAIHRALGQRAAKDLAHADLDRAISGRRTAGMGGLAALSAIAFLVCYFLLGPAPFLSLLKRMFNPFEAISVSTRTRLMLLKPEGGNATITVGRGINFAVEVSGKVPDAKAADAVKLLYRYDASDPWLERRLVPEPSGEWTTALSALEVKNGFWYQITGGDAATPEYRVGVRAAPAILDFLAMYHFRPYVARTEETRRQRELKALRGTEVLLRVRTNRTLREGRLEFTGGEPAAGASSLATTVHGQVDVQDPHTLRVQFVLNEDGKYRLYFTSTEGEVYSDPVSYPVTVVPDHPPKVELTKPGQDLRLPADALLHLEGKAVDDIGVQSLVLRMRVIGGDNLREQPYRSNEELRLADGGYPLEVEYKDFVDLARLQNEQGQRPQLHAGMELEYWLEASDACDYPRPNVAESKHYRILLTEPEKNGPQKDQEKKQAEEEKKQHAQKQDQKLQKENQERQHQRQEQQARNIQEENRSTGADKSAAHEETQPRAGQQADPSQGKENKGRQGEHQDGQSEPNHGEQKGGLSKEDQKIEEQIKKALERKEAAANGKGEGQPNQGAPGESKADTPDKTDNKGDKPQGETKQTGQQSTPPTDVSQNKDQRQTGGGPSQSDAKDSKRDLKKSNFRDQAGQTDGNKDKPEAAPQSGQGKSNSDSPSSKEVGQSKEKPKDLAQDLAKEVAKPAGDEASPSRNRPSAQEKTKPSAGQGEEEKTNKRKNEKGPDAGAAAHEATTKDIADLVRALKGQDAREREKAKQQLQRIAEQAASPEVRQEAGEALKKASESGGSVDKKTPQKDNGASRNSEDKEGKKVQGDGAGNGAASGEKENSQGASSVPEKGKGANNGTDRSSNDMSEGPLQKTGGDPSGGGDRRRGGGPSDTHDTASLPKPAKPRDPRAALMQLEDFAKRVNKDVLKDAGVSEEAWKKYLEAKRKLLMPPENPRPEAPSAPQQAHLLPSMGGRVLPSSPSGPDDVHRLDRGQPPPGYRDAFREFTRQMSNKKNQPPYER